MKKVQASVYIYIYIYIYTVYMYVTSFYEIYLEEIVYQIVFRVTVLILFCIRSIALIKNYASVI